MPSGIDLRNAPVRSCDPLFVEEFYRTYHRKLIFTCFRYTRNWEDAREMAQESFLKAFRYKDMFEFRSQPSTWLTRIAINECLTFLAKKAKQMRKSDAFFHHFESEIPSGDDPENGDSRRIACCLLDIADPVTRRVLKLILHQGLSHAQIATVMGVSRVAITRRITRFRGKAIRRGVRPDR